MTLDLDGHRDPWRRSKCETIGPEALAPPFDHDRERRGGAAVVDPDLRTPRDFCDDRPMATKAILGLYLSFAIGTFPLAVAKPKVKKLTKEAAVVATKGVLKANESIAHAVFSGPFGPAADALLVPLLRKNDKTGDSAAAAIVLAKKKRYALPMMAEDGEAYGVVEIVAVLLEDYDGDGIIDPVVMTRYMTGIGPEGAREQVENYVFRWQGATFVRLGEAEKQVKGLRSGRTVKKRLRNFLKKTGPPKKGKTSQKASTPRKATVAISPKVDAKLRAALELQGNIYESEPLEKALTTDAEAREFYCSYHCTHYAVCHEEINGGDFRGGSDCTSACEKYSPAAILKLARCLIKANTCKEEFRC